MGKIYQDSGVELNRFTAKNYDTIMNFASFGKYQGFVKRAIEAVNVQPNEKILDLGCGTGRNILLMNNFSDNKASFTGLDISKDMEKQFLANTCNYENIKFVNKRIDQLFELDEKFDKVFISFVIHGFPHKIREIVIKNAYNNLKPGGTFNILDFAEFDMSKMPFHHRLVFKKIECKYAFDYIQRDWKSILKNSGFNDFKETHFIKKYVRLLKATKV